MLLVCVCSWCYGCDSGIKKCFSMYLVCWGSVVVCLVILGIWSCRGVFVMDVMDVCWLYSVCVVLLFCCWRD